MEDKYSDSILAGNWELMEVSGLVNSTVLMDDSVDQIKADY